MRSLVLLRGIPGSGKSTFIKENGLEPYTLSPDNLRLLYASPIHTEYGITISDRNEKKVWNFLLELLDIRMGNGDFTVVDATHASPKSFTNYKKLAQQHRYRVYCVDFSHIPLTQIQKQNKSRADYKIVSDAIMERMHTNILKTTVPKWITTIKPEEFDEVVPYRSIDLSSYKQVQFIGDIHGCGTALQELLKDDIQEDTYYIFLGDYIDRGIENAETLHFLFSLLDKKNVAFLEGNHECHLWKWANDEVSRSKEFNERTQKQLEEGNVDKETARHFYRKLRQCMFFTYHEKTILATHGGFNHIPSHLHFVPTRQFIHGVGDYKTPIDHIFLTNTKDHEFQFHGHRNVQDFPTMVNERSFNLEGGVECGGHLRSVVLSKEGFQIIEVKNDVFHERFKNQIVNGTVQEMVDALRNNPHVKEQKQENNISSFNFTKSAFYDEVWNKQTVKARGLFVNTITYEIVARSYEKFFNLQEHPTTKLENLQKTLQFPVHAYEKENGFLGILGYNQEYDELIFASKSKTDGDYVDYFSTIFHKTVSEESKQQIKSFLKENNCSFVFEVIDEENDPHIIKHKEKKIVLLDCIHRTTQFSKLSFENLQEVGQSMGLAVKKHAKTLYTWDEFLAWHHDISYDFSLEFEGYVIEDAVGFMTKIKLPFYNFWKSKRTLVEKFLQDPSMNAKKYTKNPQNVAFYLWLRENEESVRSAFTTNSHGNIIAVRDLYLIHTQKEASI